MIKTVEELNEFLELEDLRLEWTFKARSLHLVTRGVSLYTISTDKFIEELDYDADGDTFMEANLYDNLSNNYLKLIINDKETVIKFPEIRIREMHQPGSHSYKY